MMILIVDKNPRTLAPQKKRLKDASQQVGVDTSLPALYQKGRRIFPENIVKKDVATLTYSFRKTA